MTIAGSLCPSRTRVPPRSGARPRNRLLLAHDAPLFVLSEMLKRIEDELSWCRKRTVFFQRSQADAITQISRYAMRSWLFSGPAFARRCIAGSLDATNTNGVIALLREGFVLAAQKKDSEIMISN